MPPDFSEILHTNLPYRPWENERTRRLPGIQPLDPNDWLLKDEAHAAQLAYRRWLIDDRLDAVMACDPSAQAAAEELRDLAGVAPASHPLKDLGRTIQQDFCILQKYGNEHILSAAILCFPASWRLDQKFMRPLSTIHDPVESYDANIAMRVQRLFDGIQVGKPLWRANYLLYEDADLHQPRGHHMPRNHDVPQFIRVERQSLVRLPQTGAIVFGIHNYVARPTAVSADSFSLLQNIVLGDRAD